MRHKTRAWCDVTLRGTRRQQKSIAHAVYTLPHQQIYIYIYIYIYKFQFSWGPSLLGDLISFFGKFFVSLLSLVYAPPPSSPFLDAFLVNSIPTFSQNVMPFTKYISRAYSGNLRQRLILTRKSTSHEKVAFFEERTQKSSNVQSSFLVFCTKIKLCLIFAKEGSDNWTLYRSRISSD